MDIYLSVNNREQVIKLPVVPNEFEVSSPMGGERWQTMNQGELNLIGVKGLRGISFKSFFPRHDYRFLKDRVYQGWDYVRALEEWRDRRVPVRLIITDTPINLPVTIDSFEYGPKDGSRDIEYSLSMTEYRFPEVR